MCFALQRWKDIGMLSSPTVCRLGKTTEPVVLPFPFTDRARKLYQAATQEKIALIRFWNEHLRNAVEMDDAERLDRKGWMQDLSLLKDQMRADLQVRAMLTENHPSHFLAFLTLTIDTRPILMTLLPERSRAVHVLHAETWREREGTC